MDFQVVVFDRNFGTFDFLLLFSLLRFVVRRCRLFFFVRINAIVVPLVFRILAVRYIIRFRNQRMLKRFLQNALSLALPLFLSSRTNILHGIP